MHTTDVIRNSLARLVKGRFPELEVPGDLFEAPLLLYLEARDLLYLFFDVEKEFGIRIPGEAVCNAGFSDLNGITGIVAECLSKANDRDPGHSSSPSEADPTMTRISNR